MIRLDRGSLVRALEALAPWNPLKGKDWTMLATVPEPTPAERTRAKRKASPGLGKRQRELLGLLSTPGVYLRRYKVGKVMKNWIQGPSSFRPICTLGNAAVDKLLKRGLVERVAEDAGNVGLSGKYLLTLRGMEAHHGKAS